MRQISPCCSAIGRVDRGRSTRFRGRLARTRSQDHARGRIGWSQRIRRSILPRLVQASEVRRSRQSRLSARRDKDRVLFPTRRHDRTLTRAEGGRLYANGGWMAWQWRARHLGQSRRSSKRFRSRMTNRRTIDVSAGAEARGSFVLCWQQRRCSRGGHERARKRSPSFVLWKKMLWSQFKDAKHRLIIERTREFAPIRRRSATFGIGRKSLCKRSSHIGSHRIEEHWRSSVGAHASIPRPQTLDRACDGGVVNGWRRRNCCRRVHEKRGEHRIAPTEKPRGTHIELYVV